jgi:hypothetical protein
MRNIDNVARAYAKYNIDLLLCVLIEVLERWFRV